MMKNLYKRKKKEEILIIFQKFRIADFEAHLRATTAPRLELMEVVEQEEPSPMPDMTFTGLTVERYHILTQIPW